MLNAVKCLQNQFNLTVNLRYRSYKLEFPNQPKTASYSQETGKHKHNILCPNGSSHF